MDAMTIRNRVVQQLQYDFSNDQLKMVDIAVAIALQNCRIDEECTMPETVDPSFPSEVKEYLVRKKMKGLSDGTLYQYEFVICTFFCYVRKKVNNVRDYDILKFLADFERIREVGKRRLDGLRVILNGFFTFLRDAGRIDINPCKTVEPIKYKENLREPLTEWEIEEMRVACVTPRDRALFEFLLSTGCRVSEAVQISRSDFKGRRLRVVGKGNKERVVFMSTKALFYINLYYAERNDNNDALFVSEKFPHGRLKKNAIEKSIKQIGERAEINRNVFPHLLRHTFATQLLFRGMKLEELQELLGHADPKTTKIYAKVAEESLERSYTMYNIA